MSLLSVFWFLLVIFFVAFTLSNLVEIGVFLCKVSSPQNGGNFLWGIQTGRFTFYPRKLPLSELARPINRRLEIEKATAEALEAQAACQESLSVTTPSQKLTFSATL